MRFDAFDANTISKAYVVFEDNTTLWWLKFLKKGFRHCYMLIKLKGMNDWIEINPMSNKTFILIRSDICYNHDYISYIRNKKHTTVCEVLELPVPYKCAPISVFSCVEAVKRIIGLHNFFIITPYQLFNKIKDCRKKVLTL